MLHNANQPRYGGHRREPYVVDHGEICWTTTIHQVAFHAWKRPLLLSWLNKCWWLSKQRLWHKHVALNGSLQTMSQLRKMRTPCRNWMRVRHAQSHCKTRTSIVNSRRPMRLSDGTRHLISQDTPSHSLSSVRWVVNYWLGYGIVLCTFSLFKLYQPLSFRFKIQRNPSLVVQTNQSSHLADIATPCTSYLVDQDHSEA